MADIRRDEHLPTSPETLRSLDAWFSDRVIMAKAEQVLSKVALLSGTTSLTESIRTTMELRKTHSENMKQVYEDGFASRQVVSLEYLQWTKRRMKLLFWIFSQQELVLGHIDEAVDVYGAEATPIADVNWMGLVLSLMAGELRRKIAGDLPPPVVQSIV